MDQATKEEVQKLLAGIPAAPKSRFSKMSLILKIGAGYAAMAIVTMAALIVSSVNLSAINQTARGMANVELPVINAVIKLRGSLLAQESFAGKYAILKDPTFIDLFRQRKKEFLANLAVLESTDSIEETRTLKEFYLGYQAASEKLFAGKSGNTAELRSSALRLLKALDAFYLKRQDRLQTMLKRADDQRRSAIRLAIGLSCIAFLLTIWVAPFVTYRIFGALGKLQKATRRFADGDYTYSPQIPERQEISDLACDFNHMAERLKELEQKNLDAIPLTRLPGNLAIERVIDERLKRATPFAFCCVNLDDFKPFSAHYGYVKGSGLLHETGCLIYAAVNEYGGANDFAGHVGGDDFVMVLSTEKVAPVCEAVIKRFDAEVTRHFSVEDLTAGGIKRCDRYGVHRFFPITTISITVINCRVDEYASSVEIARAAADVKHALKKEPGSRWETAA